MTTEEKIFDENFERTVGFLRGSVNMATFSIETIKAELQDLYKYEGLDYTGRGALKQAEIAGSILGYEVFIKEWEKKAPVESGK